jgi:hypothetical protein
VSAPEEAHFLEDNLAALSRRDPGLAGAVRSSPPDPSIAFMRARNGSIVPAALRPGGRAPLHSLYDPQQESRRLVESLKGSGCFVFLGLGAGFLVAAALGDPQVASVLVLEKDVATLRSLLQHLPLAGQLGDARVRLAAGPEAIRQRLFTAWQPALMGALQTVTLRAWCEAQPAWSAAAIAQLRLAIDEVRSDYGVQAHFGKRWFSNMLLNLEAAERPPALLPSGATAHVTAAGPSLERRMAQIASPAREGMLIASDTSLPALLRWGAAPDAVLSLDCQIYSYHHFLQGVPARTTVFLDLASPPSLARTAGRLAFIASRHPFARYVDSRWRRFPRVDTSGGNVAHAAVSLARCLGARQITLHGADFSYPRGKAYARGTYLYDFFDSTQSRVEPTESRSYAFLHRSSDLQRERHGGTWVYTTTVLREYRERMIRLMQEIDAEVIPSAGDGLALPRLSGPRAAPAEGPAETVAPPAAPRGWREFLSGYAEELAGLRVPAGAAGIRFHLLDRPQRELWETILPITARVIAEHPGELAGASALAEAKRWALQRIVRVLGGPSYE